MKVRLTPAQLVRWNHLRHRANQEPIELEMATAYLNKQPIKVQREMLDRLGPEGEQ